MLCIHASLICADGWLRRFPGVPKTETVGFRPLSGGISWPFAAGFGGYGIAEMDLPMSAIEGTALDRRKFRDALGCFATGVAVVTTCTEGEPIGITVNSFSSVSLDPPLVLWCLDKRSDTLEIFQKAESFTVNVLRDDHKEVSNRLATPGDHSLAGIEMAEGVNGCPRLVEALAHFECAVDAKHDAGDHIIFVGRVLHFDWAAEGEPLVYHRGSYRALALND